MGIVQSCIGKKNKVGVLNVEEAEAYRKTVETATEEKLQRVGLVLQTVGLNATTQISAAVADVERTTLASASTVPKLPPIFQTNSKLVQVLGFEKWKEEQKKLKVKNQENEQKKKALRKPRPKAAKFRRTVHVAFSDTS